MEAEQIGRVRRALSDAEMWTAKYIADNHHRAEVAALVQTAERALARISAAYTEIGRLAR